MFFDIPHLSQPRHNVSLKSSLSKYLKAGMIGSTMQTFAGEFVPGGVNVVGRAGVARREWDGIYDRVTFPDLTASERADAMITCGVIEGWSHTYANLRIITPVTGFNAASIYTDYVGSDRKLVAKHTDSTGSEITVTHPIVVQPGEIYQVSANWVPGVELALYVNGIKASQSTSSTGSYVGMVFGELRNQSGYIAPCPYYVMAFLVGLRNDGKFSMDFWNEFLEPERSFIPIAGPSFNPALAQYSNMVIY